MNDEGAFDKESDTAWNFAAWQRHMTAWCEGQPKNEPTESLIRRHLKELLKEMEAEKN